MEPLSPRAQEFDSAQFQAAARLTLTRNDRGGYTVPSPRLYPFQWNWDSAVVALGWMTFDEPRAWREFDRLFEGQWENGLLPHIVFQAPAETYFPGPGEWGLADRRPPTSSISQPPLAASMVLAMCRRAVDREGARRAAARLRPKLVAWHRWWFRDRDPEGTGLVVTLHPWESGLDNSPMWDEPLAAVPRTTRPYARRDLGFVDASMRPRQADYDRFVYLLDFFREARFEAARLYAECPYRVADFGLNAMLLRATEDLAELCRWDEDETTAAELSVAAARMRSALRGLWSDEAGQFCSRDTRTGRLLTAQTHSTFLAWYGGVADEEAIDRRLGARLESWFARSPYALPSTALDSPQFEAARYWRGPIWPHVNWLIATGLTRAGHAAWAKRLRDDTRRLFVKSGLREYFNPTTGEGYGGDDFSWTAAVVLFWCADDETETR